MRILFSPTKDRVRKPPPWYYGDRLPIGTIVEYRGFIWEKVYLPGPMTSRGSTSRVLWERREVMQTREGAWDYYPAPD
jgi:hypothetical protein